MCAATRQTEDEVNLRSFQRFCGTLRHVDNSLPIRFKARIRDNGEVELDLHAFRISKKSRFIRQIWRDERNAVPEFSLSGVAENGLRFESDSLTFSNLGERWSGKHNRHWSKPVSRVGEARFIRTLDQPVTATNLRLFLKGFECFPQLHADCTLGEIQVAGETKLGEPEKLTGFIAINARERTTDAAKWRSDAERLLEHVRRILSLGSATMLRAPILEYVCGDEWRVEVLSQTRQNAPNMRVFHKLDLQPALDAAIASFFNPHIETRKLFFAIEWFAMSSTYNEVCLVNAMTALENLIASSLREEDALVLPRKEFEKTRRILRKVIKMCLERWPPLRADAAREELGQKLLDLNRRPLKRKLYSLAEDWGVPLEGISDEQIREAINARNQIVHTGQHTKVEDGGDLWDHTTVVRELVIRFLLTVIGYRGHYVSLVGGYHMEDFPPSGSG